MSCRKSGIALAASAISLLACSVTVGRATEPPEKPPTETIPPPTTTAPPEPSATTWVPCEATTNSDATVFKRPDPAADVFAQVGEGFTIAVDGQTAEGWVGFDPGEAQAANIGPFRLRWLEPERISLSGACDDLPVLWAPPAGICFDMPMGLAEVHAGPDLSSDIVATLFTEQFAAVIATNGAGWAKIDLGIGNTGSTLQGWVERFTLNMNGPCQDLPVLTE